MAEYISENRLENSQPMARLYSTAVMYKNISEFINAVLTGTEGDVIRSGGKGETAGLCKPADISCVKRT